MSEARTPHSLPLAVKLPLIVGALLSVVITALLALSWQQFRAVSRVGASERLASVTAQLAQRLEAQVSSYARREAMLGQDPALRAALRAGTTTPDSGVTQALLPDSNFFAAQLLDADGRLLWAGGSHVTAIAPLAPADLRPLLAVGDSSAIGRFAALGDTLIFPTVVAIRDGDAPLGFAVRWYAIRPDPQARAAVSALVGTGARVYIGSPDGAWSDQSAMAAAPTVPVESLEQSITYTRANLGEQLVVGTRLTGAPWAIVTEFPLADVMAPATRFLNRAVLAGIVVLLLGLGVSAWATRGITRPLMALTKASDAMAAGDLTARVTAAGDDEVGRLSQAFNAMADRVTDEFSARVAAEEQWRLLFSANPYPMWVYDTETLAFLAVNEAAVSRYGWSRDEFLARTLLDIRPEGQHTKLRATLAELSEAAHKSDGWQHRGKDGVPFEVEITSSAVNFDGRPARLVMAHDISQRVVLETQLRQAQKMEAIGRLAGGIAHDFNNSLAVISAYSELLSEDLTSIGHSTTEVTEIRRAAMQASGLTRQLLTFSRRQPTRPVHVDPTLAVEAVERMVRRIIGEDVQVTVRTDAALGTVRIDPGQLEQVLLNLALNARDAMPEGGMLTLTTTSATVDEESIALYGLANPGRYVVISVSDTGSGMTREVRARIFEPFFTTKEVGKGTGLGLATAYGIVSSVGGAISVYSEVGVGSTFRVYLPRSEGSASGVSGEVAAVTTIPRGREIVLLVEDEAAVRAAASNMLQRLGYRVLEADSPTAALAIADDATQAIDMVLSDVVMPKFSGPRLVAALRERRPGLPALLMSGYVGEAVAIREVADASLPLIEKPFSLSALAMAVRGVLDG